VAGGVEATDDDRDLGWFWFLPGFATILSSRPSILFRWFITGSKSFSDAKTCTHSVSFRNRTAFDLDFEVSVVAWKIRAFSTVCSKFRSRWCKRKYCESSVDATPSSKRRFNGASRSPAVAPAQTPPMTRSRTVVVCQTCALPRDSYRPHQNDAPTSPTNQLTPWIQCHRNHEVPQQQHL